MTPTLQVVIPSRHRTHLIKHACSHFNAPLVCVDEGELKDYQEVLPAHMIITHPSHVNNLPLIRQWILDHVEADIIFQSDDDIKEVVCLVGHNPRVLTNPDDIEAVIWNAAMNCHEAGTVLFFFASNRNPKLTSSLSPFTFTGHPVGCAMGFWREAFTREIRFHPEIRYTESVYICLRVLQRYRIAWCDTRFCFQPGPHMIAGGGLAGLRTREGLDADARLLKQLFGDIVTINHTRRVKAGKKGPISGQIRINVTR